MPKAPSILIIEDEVNLRHNLTVLLAGEGYRVVSAEHGGEGIRRLQEEPFDLVITDVVMPEMDGFQVMEYLKDHMPDVVVVAITAYVSAESAIEALRRGAYDYLAKPFDVDLMQIVIKRALEKARLQKAFRHYMSALEHRVEEGTRNLAEVNVHLERSMAELREAQQQLIQTERFRTLGEMTALVAHELSNSLVMIVGFAQVLAKIAPPESRMNVQLEQISDVALRSHEIVKHLVNFPRKQAPQKVQTQVNALCELMLAGLITRADFSKIVIERQLDASLPLIMADPNQLLQAFTSIALSACKTIMGDRGGGRLAVETRHSDGVIQIAFRVGGLGLANGQQVDLLEPFLTAEESVGGLTVGLAYVMIKAHEGRLSFHSVPGEGATYVVDLPIDELSPMAAELPSSRREVVKRWRILIADADECSLTLLREIVSHLGHDAEVGSSAQQALQKIVEHDYDLIISDMHLPGMDGLHLYHWLRGLRPALAQRVIFIAGGMASDEDRVSLERLGCPLVRKPFSVADIEASIRQALGLCGS